MKWPAHGVTMRTAAQHADKIRKAFNEAFDSDAIAEAWTQTHLGTTTTTPQMARDWAHIHITIDKKKLADILPKLYADGYVIGENAGAYMLSNLTRNKAVSAGVVDWDTWKPGNQAASALLKPKGGLQNLLDSRNVTIDGISNTKLDRIGTVLSKALEQGLTPKDIAPMIDQVVDDPQSALSIAQTEMSRAVSVASRDLYENSGVEQVEWLVAEGCDDCQDNADASPIEIDDTFPTGDTEPPAHPNCMCALAPYIDTSDIELSSQADLVKFVPSKNEVDRALSRLKILPNAPEQDEKTIEAPWKRIDPITVDPNIWNTAELALVNLADLTATDEVLNRKKLKKHIKAMGQTLLPFRSYALIIQQDDQLIIIDGHHRLFSLWLLGNQTAPVWLAKES